MKRLSIILPLLFGLACTAPAHVAQAQVAIGATITLPPPDLPAYTQPPIPGLGYIWTPGYWAWGADGYYWVAGSWVLPPAVGLLWTPGYWGWSNGLYAWNAGYWGPTVGFYGGINYGFGYTGNGYWGGRWDHGHFAYNTTVNNFGGKRFTNTYSEPFSATNESRKAFNGGAGGTYAHPTAAQEAYAHERHIAPTSAQVYHERTGMHPGNTPAVIEGAPHTATSHPVSRPSAVSHPAPRAGAVVASHGPVTHPAARVEAPHPAARAPAPTQEHEQHR
jgi:hypothetical protein